MKILKLMYSELLKITKKLSFKVCLIILIALAILVPFLYKAFVFDDSSNSLYTKSTLNFYKNEIIKNPKNDYENIMNDLNNVMIETINMSLNEDKNATNTPYKSSLYDAYTNNKMDIVCIDYISQKKDVDYNKVDDNFGTVCSSYNSDNTSLTKIKKEKIISAQNIKKEIMENNYSNHLKRELELLKSQTKTSDKVETIKVYEKLVELNITDETDFRVEAANTIIDSYNQKERIISKADYNKSNSNITYDEYVLMTKLKNKDSDNKITKSWYEINNNVNHDNSKAKSAFNDTIQTNVLFLSIITIIIAGGIVSNEFQKGTIRLLVIRPNKRWKILLSKFLAVLLLIISFALITYFVSFITTGLLFGFDKYMISDLIIRGKKVVEINFVLNSLYRMLILLIPTFFVGLIAFSLSAVTKNTALSVGLSIFLLVGANLIVAFASLINIPYLDLTFLPYLDYNSFLDIPSLIDMCNAYDFYFNIKKANLVLLSWGIICYFITNMYFIKKDIKN